MGNTPSTQTEQPSPAPSSGANTTASRPEPERRWSRFDMIGGFNIEPAPPAPKRATTSPSVTPAAQPERAVSPPPRSASPAPRTLWQQSPSYSRQPSRDAVPSPVRSYEPYAARRRSPSVSVSSTASSTVVSTVSAAGTGSGSPKRASEALKRVNSTDKPIAEEIRPVVEEATLDSTSEVAVPQEVVAAKEEKHMGPLTEEPEEVAEPARANEEVPEAPKVESKPAETPKVEEVAEPASIVDSAAASEPAPTPEEKHVHFAGSPELPSEDESVYQDVTPGATSENGLADVDFGIPTVGSFDSAEEPTTLAIPARVEDDDPKTPVGRTPSQLVMETSPTSPAALVVAAVDLSTSDVPSPTAVVRPPTPPNTSHAIPSFAAATHISSPIAPSDPSADSFADVVTDAGVALPPSPLPLSLNLGPYHLGPSPPRLVMPSGSPTTPTTAESGPGGTPRTPVSAIALSHARLAHAQSAMLVHVRTPPPDGPVPLPAIAILEPSPRPAPVNLETSSTEESNARPDAEEAHIDHSPPPALEQSQDSFASAIDDSAASHSNEETDISAERPAPDSSPVELRSDDSPVELGTDARFDVPRLRLQAPAVPFPLLGSPMSPVEARETAAKLVGDMATEEDKAEWRDTVYIEAEDGERSGWESDEETEEGGEERVPPVEKDDVHVDEEMEGGEGEVYQVVNTTTETAMDLSGNDRKSILGWAPHQGRNQQWVFNPWGRGFTIRCAWGGGYVGLEDGLDDGAELAVSEYPMAWRLEAIDGAEGIFRIYWPSGKYAIGLEAGSNRVKLCSITNTDGGYEWKFTRHAEHELRVQPVAPPRSPLSVSTPVVAPEQATVSTVVTTRVQQDGRDLGPAPEGKQIVLAAGRSSDHHHGEWMEETMTTTTVTTVTTIRRKRC